VRVQRTSVVADAGAPLLRIPAPCPAPILISVPAPTSAVARSLAATQGLLSMLLMETGKTCTSDGLYCFSGLPGADAVKVFDTNADDKFNSLFTMDTRYGGGGGVANGWESDVETFVPKPGTDADYMY